MTAHDHIMNILRQENQIYMEDDFDEMFNEGKTLSVLPQGQETDNQEREGCGQLHQETSAAVTGDLRRQGEKENV